MFLSDKENRRYVISGIFGGIAGACTLTIITKTVPGSSEKFYLKN